MPTQHPSKNIHIFYIFLSNSTTKTKKKFAHFENRTQDLIIAAVLVIRSTTEPSGPEDHSGCNEAKSTIFVNLFHYIPLYARSTVHLDMWPVFRKFQK